MGILKVPLLGKPEAGEIFFLASQEKVLCPPSKLVALAPLSILPVHDKESLISMCPVLMDEQPVAGNSFLCF